MRPAGAVTRNQSASVAGSIVCGSDCASFAPMSRACAGHSSGSNASPSGCAAEQSAASGTHVPEESTEKPGSQLQVDALPTSAQTVLCASVHGFGSHGVSATHA